MSEQALSGVKVLDLTHHITGPFCTKLLADYGAEVIKIERPDQGDITRRMGPFFEDTPHPEKSGLFLHLNTNKKGITLNLKSEQGREIFIQLLKTVDIFVENFSPGVMTSLGLGYEMLEAIHPKLVMTSVSNFGGSGPYRDYKATELTLYGLGGAQYMCGIPEREPQKLYGSFLLFEAGVTAANATLAAYLVAEFQDVGQHIDMAITEAIASGVDRLHTNLVAYAFNKEIQSRFTIVSAYAPGTGAYPCKDGWIDLVVMGPQYLERTKDLLEHPPFLDDPKWADYSSMSDPELRDEFLPFYLNWLADKTKNEVMALAEKNSILGSPVNNVSDVFADPHFAERETFIEIDHPMTGPLKYAARPFRMGGTPWQLRRPAPLLGEHNEEVYTGLGYSGEELVMLKETGVI